MYLASVIVRGKVPIPRRLSSTHSNSPQSRGYVGNEDILDTVLCHAGGTGERTDAERGLFYAGEMLGPGAGEQLIQRTALRVRRERHPAIWHSLREFPAAFEDYIPRVPAP